jgi:hypothetical protein
MTILFVMGIICIFSGMGEGEVDEQSIRDGKVEVSAYSSII